MWSLGLWSRACSTHQPGSPPTAGKSKIELGCFTLEYCLESLKAYFMPVLTVLRKL